MSEIDYSRANVLLFDPIHVNQRTTRYTLFEIGFRQIECVSNLAEFKTALADTAPTLVVAESGATDADVFKIVRAVRRSELGSNPFVLFLLTTWSRDHNHIRKAIECGSDDVIVRPFSTMFVEDRVKTLVHNRKEFVVTSEYVGPDRRKDKSRETDAPSVTVPNVLKATVEGDTEALSDAASWIKEANDTIVAERLRRMAMRIVVSIELQLAKDDETKPSVKLDLDDIARTARELKIQLIKAKRPEAVEVAEALLGQVDALSGENGITDKGLRLTKELAMGTYAAYADGGSLERSKNEIGRTVTSLKKRINTRTASTARKKAEMEKAADKAEADGGNTADDAGHDGGTGIKRAAI